METGEARRIDFSARDFAMKPRRNASLFAPLSKRTLTTNEARLAPLAAGANAFREIGCFA